jgi:hypothetical protein
MHSKHCKTAKTQNQRDAFFKSQHTMPYTIKVRIKKYKYKEIIFEKHHY